MTRPGISPECLVLNGVREVDGDEAMQLCNIKEPGLWIPYHTSGSPIWDQGGYGRLRMHQPRDDRKYHQRVGTAQHAYVPVQVSTMLQAKSHDYLVVVEGEFKALSLVDAGIPAVGISGFYGAIVSFRGMSAVVPELQTVLMSYQLKRILFLGDNDTALNHQFADAVAKFVKLSPLPVVLPRLSLAGAKGIDDCRHADTAAFQMFWARLVHEAIPVDKDASADKIALLLAQHQRTVIRDIRGDQRAEFQRKLARVAAMMGDPLVAEEIINLAIEVTAAKSRPFRRAMDLERERLQRELSGAKPWADGGNVSPDGRPRVLLPGLDREDSAFVREVAQVIAPKNQWFNRGGEVQIVVSKSGGEVEAFQTLSPVSAITELEKHVQTGHLDRNMFVARSVTSALAATLLKSEILCGLLPSVERILSVPIPLRGGVGLNWPRCGYNPGLKAWLTQKPWDFEMPPLEGAQALLGQTIDEFPFADAASRANATAYLLTPFCRGLFSSFNTRTPLFQFIANRPRAGKDYLANIAGLLYEGSAREDPPILNQPQELQKYLLAAVREGRRRLHFANCREHIDNPVLEQFLTSKTFTSRILGVSENFTAENDLDVSLSGNVGISCTTDLEQRSRLIRLEFYEEDANGRVFINDQLHEWILENRVSLLSAFARFIQVWIEAGRPAGPTPFTSFSEWGRVVGGIMNVAGLGDPCIRTPSLVVPLDACTEYWTQVFAVMRDAWPGQPVSVRQIVETLVGQSIGFPPGKPDHGDGATNSFSRGLRRYAGRTLAGTKLEVFADTRSDRDRFQFTPVPKGKEGEVGE